MLKLLDQTFMVRLSTVQLNKLKKIASDCGQLLLKKQPLARVARAILHEFTEHYDSKRLAELVDTLKGIDMLDVGGRFRDFPGSDLPAPLEDDGKPEGDE
jgi:hypothetical protein